MSLGLGSSIRIPVPGTNGLAIELYPRGWRPRTGSTSSLFIQDVTGKRHLRLDFGYNQTTGATEWHWNQEGTKSYFGITTHTPVGSAEQALGKFAKYYKYAGETFVVIGAYTDLYSIVTSSRPLRRTVQVVSAWTAAGEGCEALGAGGAALGSFVLGAGTAAGGFLGCAVGGFLGYITAEKVSGYLYDWAEGTIFTTLAPEPDPAAQRTSAAPSGAPSRRAGAGGS